MQDAPVRVTLASCGVWLPSLVSTARYWTYRDVPLTVAPDVGTVTNGLQDPSGVGTLPNRISMSRPVPAGVVADHESVFQALEL